MNRKLSSIGRPKFFWRVEDDRVIIEHDIPGIIIVLIVCFFIYIALPSSLAEETLGETIFYLTLWIIGCGYAIYFGLRSPSETVVSKKGIDIKHFIRTKHYNAQKIDFELRIEKVGGNFPHSEVRFIARLDDSKELSLIVMKGYESERPLYNELVAALEHVSKKE